MERLVKIGIVIAIAIGLIFFSLFLITIIPHIVANTQRDWGDILTPKLTDDDAMEIFSSEQVYSKFKEKYPDASEVLKNNNNRNARMELTAMNFTTFHYITLNMDYDIRDQMLDYSIRCNLSGDERLPSARDTLAILYLQYTQCLQIPKKSFVNGNEDVVYHDYDESVYPVPSAYQLAVERESAGLRAN
ncbi:hypothetical protein [Candidatus Nitrosopumilus sediminis]|uniref:Uncharacterized protein n=1 Tax=Candidatus Nitrosopumilus sediminis TaxID=1229909 RepID=K0BBT8_9ARCH|nr:hypothetical protein [Candidatus Nitrosopumilus sediminis]AFS82597.1 hypothetical protein NSED_03955 [Candidatus Nitrosopumilus sediminis]